MKSRNLVWFLFFVSLLFVSSEDSGSKTKLKAKSNLMSNLNKSDEMRNNQDKGRKFKFNQANLSVVNNATSSDNNLKGSTENKQNKISLTKNDKSHNHSYNSNSFSYLSAFDRKHTFLTNSFDLEGISVYKTRQNKVKQ